MTGGDLVLFACPGLPESRVVRAYEAAVEGAVLQWIAPVGRSAVFTAAGQACRDAQGRTLPGLVERYSGRPIEVWSSVSLISYSAGYGLAREVLRDEDDREALSGYVAIDSIHSGLAAGRPRLDLLAGFAAYAERAREWRAIFALGHSDVPTAQAGDLAFASTTQCAAALVGLAGEPDGGWIVRSYDVADAKHPMREHGLALTQWGPELVAGTLGGWLRAWRDFRAAGGAGAGCEVLEASPATLRTGAPPPAWLDGGRPVRERAVEWSLAELAAGVAEVPPGSNTGPRIREYLAPCERGGRLLRLTAAPWCAAAACAAERAVLLAGESAALPYRCSGLELEADARAAGLWRPKGQPFQPRRGDLAIYRRTSASDPAGAWQRHVVRVTEPPDGAGAWRSIGGNEGDRWALTARSMGDAGLVGFVALP